MPTSFYEGMNALELEEMSELELACLMNILAKPTSGGDVDNIILVDELVSIMENFGIVEGEMGTAG